MIGIRRLLSRRFTKPAVLVAAVSAILLGATGTANAAIYWHTVMLVNQTSQQCVAGEYDNVRFGDNGSMVPGCMANGNSQIWLESDSPDVSGHAVVHIMTWGQSNIGDEYEWLCLAAGRPYTGPNGGEKVYWDLCGAEDSWQSWEMFTAAPPQDVGNPYGLKHFINFYNVDGDACLDGGVNLYAFRAQCSTSDNWQIWNIYTNQGSQPYSP